MSTEKRSKRAVYIPPLTCTSIRTIGRMIGSIALAHVKSSNHLVSRAMLSHYLTTLLFIVLESLIDAGYFARFTSHNGRSRSCELRTITFSHAITSATISKNTFAIAFVLQPPFSTAHQIPFSVQTSFIHCSRSIW